MRPRVLVKSQHSQMMHTKASTETNAIHARREQKANQRQPRAQFYGADKAINSQGTKVGKMKNMSARRASRLKTLIQNGDHKTIKWQQRMIFLYQSRKQRGSKEPLNEGEREE